MIGGLSGSRRVTEKTMPFRICSVVSSLFRVPQVSTCDATAFCGLGRKSSVKGLTSLSRSDTNCPFGGRTRRSGGSVDGAPPRRRRSPARSAAGPRSGRPDSRAADLRRRTGTRWCLPSRGCRPASGRPDFGARPAPRRTRPASLRRGSFRPLPARAAHGRPDWRGRPPTVPSTFRLSRPRDRAPLGCSRAGAALSSAEKRPRRQWTQRWRPQRDSNPCSHLERVVS